MKSVSISLIDYVDGTATNIEGCKFKVVLEDYVKEDYNINISLKNITPLSSSFLNSSFGELVDSYGFEKTTSLLSFSSVTKFHAKTIERYFSALKEHVK